MVDFNLEKPGDHNYIRCVDNNGIKIHDKYYRKSILLSPDNIPAGWAPANMHELQASDLEAIFELQPEVALLGTGPRHELLSRELLIEVYRRGVGLEVMSTRAACRTFNVLVSDDRRVVAGLLPL